MKQGNLITSESQKIETVNVSMNWKGCAGIIAITLENGNAQGVKAARAELQNMATAADLWNDNAGALVALVRAGRASIQEGGPVPMEALRVALLPFAVLVKE